MEWITDKFGDPPTEREEKETNPLMQTLLDIARIPAFRAAWEGGVSAVIEKEDIRHEEF